MLLDATTSASISVEALPPSSSLSVSTMVVPVSTPKDSSVQVVEEEMVTYNEEAPSASLDIEDLSVEHESVIADSEASISLNETVVAGHPEQSSTDDMNDDDAPMSQDTVDMESDDIPTVIQTDVHMQTVNEQVLPVDVVQAAAPAPSVPRKRPHEVEAEKNVQTRSSKRLKTKVSVLEDCTDSVMATEQTYVGGGDIPVDSLRTMLKTRTEIVDLCLAEANSYQLEVIKKKYAVPDDYKTNREFSDYLRGLGPPGMTLKQFHSDWWAVVPVEFVFDPRNSIPEQDESNGGYCISTMGFHGLLGLVIQFRIPVWQFHIHSAVSLRKRIQDFVIGSDSESLFIINDGDGLAYLCFE